VFMGLRDQRDRDRSRHRSLQLRWCSTQAQTRVFTVHAIHPVAPEVPWNILILEFFYFDTTFSETCHGLVESRPDTVIFREYERFLPPYIWIMVVCSGRTVSIGKCLVASRQKGVGMIKKLMPSECPLFLSPAETKSKS
jgi:hypothetical protein